MKDHIIIMADIIRSRDLDAKKAMKLLKELTEQVNKEFGNDIQSPLTITLGDEFQGVVKTFQNAMGILIRFEELLISSNAPFKQRYVILKGIIETPINPESAHEMLGEGLTEARTILNGLKKSNDRFFIKTGDPARDEALQPALRLFQYFIGYWSQRDYYLVQAFLEFQDYKLVAEKLKKDVSLMWRREQSLLIPEYRESKKLLTLLSQSQ